MVKFLNEKTAMLFGLPGFFMSDKATCFIAGVVQSFMKELGKRRKTALAYALVSDGRAGRILETIN